MIEDQHIYANTKVFQSTKKVQNKKLCRKVIPSITKLTGYEFNPRRKRHNIEKSWANFTMKDCIVPGKRDYKLANRWNYVLNLRPGWF